LEVRAMRSPWLIYGARETNELSIPYPMLYQIGRSFSANFSAIHGCEVEMVDADIYWLDVDNGNKVRIT
jgi:hypothetical protein